jgi:glucosylceramidase
VIAARSDVRVDVRAALLLFALTGCASTSAVPTRKATPARSIQMWLTTPDRAHLLERQRDLSLAANDDTTATRIEIDPNVQFQVMAGFGAAITDASASMMQTRLSLAQRESLLQEMFGRTGDGVGFSLVRLTIGASDFSQSHYTFDDLPTGERDDALSRFSIDAQRRNVLPIVQRARAINPQLTVIATPWSAPAWMKSSRSLIGGTLRPDAYAAFAEYLRKYVHAFATEDVPIFALTVQNEPHNEPKDYPGMRFDAADRAAFIGHHLGPLFAARGLNTRILDWDHNWDEPQSPLHVLRDSVAAPFVSGSAWHCYAGDVRAQSQVHDATPDKDVWFTECAGGAWAPDFGENLRWNVRTLVIGATRNWARGVALWNLALDTEHGPHLGGCDNCRGVITIDAATGGVTRNEEFYALAHASRFVLPGARRITSTTGVDEIETVAFRNPDGTVALIVCNSSSVLRRISVRMSSHQFRAQLPAGSVATLSW